MECLVNAQILEISFGRLFPFETGQKMF